MDELLYYDLKDVSGLTPGLATQVCREVGRRIIAGHFPEGQFIDDENRLCDRFNVSKSVVREAIKILVSAFINELGFKDNNLSENMIIEVEKMFMEKI